LGQPAESGRPGIGLALRFPEGGHVGQLAGIRLVVVEANAEVAHPGKDGIHEVLRSVLLSGLLTVVNMTLGLMLVNIEVYEYPWTMARTRTTSLDPEIRLLAALADPTRLAIVRQLAQDTETCACDFTSCCDVAQPTVSHHLRVLREAGIVTSERRGQWIFYRLAPETAERLGAVARTLVPGGLVTVNELVARRGASTAAKRSAATPAHAATPS